MKLKIGIIGTNFISDWFADAARQVPGAVLHAVYSRKKETGDAFAGKLQIPHVYDDYEAFLASDIDAVYVASPNFAHCGQTIRALECGKHVLCEKVMAVNEEEVRAMIDCAQQNRVVLLEAMRPDFDPAFRIVEERFSMRLARNWEMPRSWISGSTVSIPSCASSECPNPSKHPL